MAQYPKRKPFHWGKYMVSYFWWTFFLSWLPLILFIISIFWFGFSGFGLFGMGYKSYFGLKLINWIAVVMLLGGSYNLNIKLLEYWIYFIFQTQIMLWYKIPANEKVTYKIIIPDNYNYDTKVMKNFMKDMYDGFYSENVTWESVLNYGKGYQSVCFDCVAENGKIECFVSIAFSRSFVLRTLLEKYFPELSLVEAIDPYQSAPKTFKEDRGFMGYETMSGTNLATTKSSIYPFPPNIFTDPVIMAGDNFLRYCRDTLPNSKIVIQFIFIFNSGRSYDLMVKEFNQYRQNLFERFTPKKGTKKQSGAFGILLPMMEKESLQKIEHRLNKNTNKLFSSNIKVVGFCSNQDYVRVEQVLDKAIRIFYGGTVEKKYLTATNQTYYNHTGKNNIPNQDWLYDTFVFPPLLLEPYLSDSYNRFFYPNENRWRRKSLYRYLVRRSAYGPWSHRDCLLDAEDVSVVFNIPSQSKEPVKINEHIIGMGV